LRNILVYQRSPVIDVTFSANRLLENKGNNTPQICQQGLVPIGKEELSTQLQGVGKSPG
jgi:hypothetical protein